MAREKKEERDRQKNRKNVGAGTEKGIQRDEKGKCGSMKHERENAKERENE